VCLVCTFACSAFELRFGADIERLNNPSVHCGDDIHCAIQVWVRNSCFPCVRKASFDSRLTVPHHSYGQAHKHLLALAQIRHGMGITVKLSKIGPVTHGFLLIFCDGFVPPQYTTP
jgi:hypothetical protein